MSIAQTVKALSVLVLADEANVNGMARSYRRKVNWETVRDYVANKEEGRILVEMVLYVGLPPTQAAYVSRREGMQGFVRWAEHRGFLVVTKDGVPKDTERQTFSANVDVMMAIDAMELALTIQPDIIVIVSGDNDFSYLAHQLRRRGIRVEIAFAASKLSDTLKRSANGVIDLTHVVNEFDALDGETAPVIGGLDIFDTEDDRRA